MFDYIDIPMMESFDSVLQTWTGAKARIIGYIPARYTVIVCDLKGTFRVLNKLCFVPVGSFTCSACNGVHELSLKSIARVHDYALYCPACAKTMYRRDFVRDSGYKWVGGAYAHAPKIGRLLNVLEDIRTTADVYEECCSWATGVKRLNISELAIDQTVIKIVTRRIFARVYERQEAPYVGRLSYAKAALERAFPAVPADIWMRIMEMAIALERMVTRDEVLQLTLQ